MEPLVLAIDSGTGSTRALAFDLAGRLVDSARAELAPQFPQPGWVEQDAADIWRKTLVVAGTLLQRRRVAAIGLANQRETIVFWSRNSGEPLAPAIVWQDRRTADYCDRLRADGHEPLLQRKTGLVVDPYFSASKIRWALDHWPDVRAAADRGDLAVGTIDSWILCKLSGVHLTDASNASRTQLMDLHKAEWSTELLDLFGIPGAILPAIAPTAGLLAETRLFGPPVPITGMAGDQQAATIGQGCLERGQAKCTYGTGLFLLGNAGGAPPKSGNRLLATFLASSPQCYALEGSAFVGGSAVQWLRDRLRLIAHADDTEALARSVPDSGGVTFVPAFNGLGAPWWEARARGTLAGLSGGTGIAHIVRATLEAMGQQTADLLEAFRADGVAPETLRIDGGMVKNQWLCQDIADSCGLVVERPANIETTALGAAMLAAVGIGLFPGLQQAAAAMAHTGRRFEPMLAEDARQRRRANWKRAIAQTRAGIEPQAGESG